MSEIQQTVILVAIHLGLSLALALIFLMVTKSEKKKLLVIFALAFLTSTAILFIPNAPFLSGLIWNWQGKFLTCTMALLFVIYLPYVIKKEAGFTFKINKSVWIPFIVLTILCVGYNIY